MAFPSYTVSASDIRAQLAGDNTAGAQTPVTLNDTAVRAAANVPSGSIAYSQLRGVNVLYSGLITFSYRAIQVGQGSYVRVAGYAPNFFPQYGGPIGSVNTTTYYKNWSGGALTELDYDFSNLSNTYTTIGTQIALPTGLTTLYVNFNTTRYTFTGVRVDAYRLVVNGDPFGLQTKGNNGETYQIVITY